VTNLSLKAGVLHIFGSKSGAQFGSLFKFFDIPNCMIQKGYADIPIAGPETQEVQCKCAMILILNMPLDIDHSDSFVTSVILKTLGNDAKNELPSQLNMWIDYTGGVHFIRFYPK
jgi:hypothetical protein